jgi:hypothetical protein
MDRKDKRKDKRTNPCEISEGSYRMFQEGFLNINHPPQYNWLLGYSDRHKTETKKYRSGIEILKNRNYATTEVYIHS